MAADPGIGLLSEPRQTWASRKRAAGVTLREDLPPGSAEPAVKTTEGPGMVLTCEDSRLRRTELPIGAWLVASQSVRPGPSCPSGHSRAPAWPRRRHARGRAGAFPPRRNQ